MATPNWIADTNRFNLPKPPQWVLTKFYEFDPMLVLIPSRFQRKYLLTRRRLHSAGLGDVAMLDNKHPDTNMCVMHGVVPVFPIVSRSGAFEFEEENVNQLLDELRRRDTWELTGGPGGKDPDAAWKMVEDHEAAVERKQHREMKEGFRYMARDAWRSIQARMGWRNKRSHDGNRHARVGAGEKRKIVSRPISRATAISKTNRVK